MKLSRVPATPAANQLKADLLDALIKYLETDHSGMEANLVLMYAVNALSFALAEFVYPAPPDHILEMLGQIYPKQAKLVQETLGAPFN